MTFNPKRDLYLRRKVAARQLFLGPDGKLTANARLLLTYFRAYCHAHRSSQLIAVDATGAVDAVATTARAARREVYDRFVNLLNLDDYEVVNLQED